MPRPYEPHKAKFAYRLQELRNYLRESQDVYPPSNDESSKQLYRWIRIMRMKKRLGVLPSSFVGRLLSTDPSFFHVQRGRKRADNGWKQAIHCSPAPAFDDNLSNFRDHQGRPYAAGLRSVREYVLGRLRITKDVSPSECSLTGPDQLGKVHRCLAFLKVGGFFGSVVIAPTWTRADIKSSYFSREVLVGNDGKQCEAKARENFETIINTAFAATSPEELIDFLKNMTELDDVHCGKTGRFYKEVIRLNASKHPQPRRTTYSVTINEPRWSPLHKCTIQDLFSYGHVGRPPPDWRSRPIPTELYQFGEHLWKRLYDKLTPVSKCCPPTAVQALYYFEMFGAKISPHKDNGIREDSDGLQSRMSTDPELNSQIVGSSVIVYSIGDAMEFGLLKPNVDFRCNQKNHQWTSDGRVTLEDGSAFVLDPADDENFMHAARFEKVSRGVPKDRIRVALVFRWLSCRASFYGADKKAPRQHAQDVPNAIKLFDKGKHLPWECLFKYK
jgi:hypothetical protein